MMPAGTRGPRTSHRREQCKRGSCGTVVRLQGQPLLLELLKDLRVQQLQRGRPVELLRHQRLAGFLPEPSRMTDQKKAPATPLPLPAGVQEWTCVRNFVLLNQRHYAFQMISELTSLGRTRQLRIARKLRTGTVVSYEPFVTLGERFELHRIRNQGVAGAPCFAHALFGYFSIRR